MISQGKRVVVLFVLLLFVVSCATMDPRISYLATRDTFNEALRNYSERVKAMPVAEEVQKAEKAALKATFNPLWKDAATALDGWGGVIEGISTEDPAIAIRKFTDAKNALIKLMIKHFGSSLFGE